MWVQPAVFYIFASMFVVCSLAVILSRNSVKAALSLVACFLASAVLWMLLEGEFLALALIFVYVGAVMTLFLFVVMMLNLDEEEASEGFVRYWPLVLVLVAAIAVMLYHWLSPVFFGVSQFPIPAAASADYSNVNELGSVLYTDYVYAFECAAVLLLIAIVSAIALAFRGSRNRKVQNISEQVAVTAKDRLKIVKMRSEPKGDQS